VKPRFAETGGPWDLEGEGIHVVFRQKSNYSIVVIARLIQIQATGGSRRKSTEVTFFGEDA